jgi:hypothetical protein
MRLGWVEKGVEERGAGKEDKRENGGGKLIGNVEIYGY